MTDNSRLGQLLLAGIALAFQGCVTADVQQTDLTPDASAGFDAQALANDARFEKFAAHSEQSRYTIDHAPWAQFMSAAVFDLGPSSRQSATRRTGGVHTGTRISTGSRSRYRWEGNRMMFHLLNDDAREFISIYRGELTDIMDNFDYAQFGRDEQLAFWLNLHNVILIDEIAKRYPVSRPRSIRIRDQSNARLFDAKLVRIAGEPLSLNDIRHKIVYANWSEPQVIYGLWDGTIGGVDVVAGAFTGATVWTMLRSNANGYVNSLRGVEATSGDRFGKVSFRVSNSYFEARRLFPGWPSDLYAHLDSHAGVTVGDLLARPPSILRRIPYDSSTADFSGGEVARFGGDDNIAAILSNKGDGGEEDAPLESQPAGTAATVLENFGAPVLNRTFRGGVSPDSIRLRDIEIENRQRRERDVNIEDVETPDVDDPETDAPDPVSDEDESDASTGEN